MTITEPRPVQTAFAPDPVYFLTRDDAEARRLIQQGRLYDPSTRWLLERAGLRPGMKVLDVGSGSGDVALLARQLVGKHGAVVGVDSNAEILALAGSRAEAAGYRNVHFVPGDVRTVELAHDFDAVIGRFVLMYIGDPVAAIVNGLHHVVPGGIVAFQEMNLDASSVLTVPRIPLWDQVWTWICRAAEAARIETLMGYRMREVYSAAGLIGVQAQLSSNLGAGPDDEVYDYVTASLRSMLPVIISSGVATAEEIDIETLADRLRTATLARQATVKYPNLVGSWGYKP